MVDYANDGTTHDLHNEDFTVVIESEIDTENGKLYEIPEEYGRVVAFQVEQPSSVIGTARTAYRQEGYRIDPSKMIPWTKCTPSTKFDNGSLFAS